MKPIVAIPFRALQNKMECFLVRLQSITIYNVRRKNTGR